jgi:hypothetical protein
VRSVTGTRCSIIGGSGNGVITNEKLGYEGYQVGAIALFSDVVILESFLERGLPDNEFNAGLALGNQIKENVKDLNALLLFIDLIRGKPTESIRANAITPETVLQGVKQGLGVLPPTGGASLLGNWQFMPSFQFCDAFVGQHAVMALAMSGAIQMDSVFIFGLKPSSGYYTITKAKGNWIQEIDNVPAAELVSGALGVEPDSLNDYMVTLGVNIGDKFDEFDPENSVNYVVFRNDPNSNALFTYRPDVKEGMKFQLMRENFSDFEYLRERCTTLLERVKNKRPLFALYFVCAIRASAYSRTDVEEGDIIRDLVGSRMPLLGVYTGGEIGRVKDEIKTTIWNSLLCIFCEADG